MSMEADLSALLKTVCPRAFAVVAKGPVAKPFIVWQPMGGEALRNLDNTPSDKRKTSVMVSVYADNYLAAVTLLRQAEEALTASPALEARPTGEPMSTYEDDVEVFGAKQMFSVISSR